MIRIYLTALLFLIHLSSSAQDEESLIPDQLLRGSVDMHVHSSPDVRERSINDIELARLAKMRGFRAVVIKNHFSSTAARAVLTNYVVDGIDVYGGIVLNKSVGGINAHAVESMAMLSPEFGKIVWFPTYDAQGNKHALEETGTGLTIIDNDTLSKEAVEVLALIKHHDLVLATGHLSPEEILLLLKTAHSMGIKKIMVTHVLHIVPNLTVEQMKEIVDLGGILELTYLSYLTGHQSHPASPHGSGNVSMRKMSDVINRLGAHNFILTSDLGQSGNPLPPDGLKSFVEGLLQVGISSDQIILMIKTNPNTLLN